MQIPCIIKRRYFKKEVYLSLIHIFNVNPNSLTVIKEAYVEPELEKYDKEDSFQFMRTGYFCLDSKDSTKEHMVFNRIVSLKSSYKPN